MRKEERWKKADATRPSVVLGIRPGDDAKWQNCDLAKVLVNEEELISSTELQPKKHPIGTVYLPKQMGFGVGRTEKELLFRKLPMLSAEATGAVPDAHDAASNHFEDVKKELSKANAFAKLLDLRNASAGGIAYENRRRIITAFSGPENRFDPGRSEVQGAWIDIGHRSPLLTWDVSCPLDIPDSQSLDPSDKFQTRHWESAWASKARAPASKDT